MFEIVLRPKSLLESDCVGVKQQGHQERGVHWAGETFDRARHGSYLISTGPDRPVTGGGRANRTGNGTEVSVLACATMLFAEVSFSRMAPRPALHAVQHTMGCALSYLDSFTC